MRSAPPEADRRGACLSRSSSAVRSCERRPRHHDRRKLMQGESAAEIPIERPARGGKPQIGEAIGIGVRTSILVRADEVIE